MDNVIRPDFQRAAKARNGDARKPRAQTPMQYIKTYGEVGTHAVSLVRTRSGLRGDIYQVVIDTPAGQVGPVGVEPATDDGMFDADRVGMAVIRTLELLARRSGDFDVA
ncbi:hypothetical protein LRS73_10360 [Methylobacterium currus]|uniref:hypothetical protein n=1 Tax=Methylobacterium currus TaxID=2051553 RepID=UPI001E4D205D|nr:hypothetical protein [Methylobacterium currus]UHC18204.1 hypothetical protein LRS73_10360 [Methylobacterium currus]